MATRAWAAVLTLFSVACVVAGEASPYEKALEKVVQSFDKISDSLKTIIDEDSANTAKPELRKAADAFIAVRAKADQMQPPEKDEKIRLEKLFKPKMDASMKRMFTEMVRVELIPGGKEALKEISGVLKKPAK
jgi:hypothetical protein